MLADGGSVYGRGQRGGGWEEMWTRWQAVTTGGAGGGGSGEALAEGGGARERGLRRGGAWGRGRAGQERRVGSVAGGRRA